MVSDLDKIRRYEGAYIPRDGVLQGPVNVVLAADIAILVKREKEKNNHWQLYIHDTYAEILCSCCGQEEWKCTTLYPEYSHTCSKVLEDVRKNKKFCYNCGAEMKGD